MDESVKHSLAAYFATQPVDAVYLFGSQATGNVNAMSDIDVAVLFAEGLSDSERFDLRLAYMSQVGRLTGFADKAEVIDLGKVPLALQFSAIHPRQELYVRHPSRRTLFEAEVASRYFDYQYFVKQNTHVSLASMSQM